MSRFNLTSPTIGCCLAALLLVGGGSTALAQHGHLNSGALGQNQGDKLNFANGDVFAAGSGYVKEMLHADSGTYSGYYEGNISLTALPTTVDNGGPVPNAPAPGSFIMFGIDSVSGPAGGQFGFWDAEATVPTAEYGVGYDVAAPTTLFALSDASNGAGEPGADPFGHLHGRRFTFTEPGMYTVGFKLFDVSVNGAGGGPIHTPSDVLLIQFSAIPEPSVISLLGLGALAFGGQILRRARRNSPS